MTYEPIVYFEAPSTVLGAFHPKSIYVNRISKEYYEKIDKFYYQYSKPVAGCARPSIPKHLWTVDGETPILYELYYYLNKSSLFEPIAIQKDITNRTVGLIAQVKDDDTKQFYLPTADDGYMITDLVSNYGYENIPFVKLDVLLTALTGVDGEGGICETFDILFPKRVRITSKKPIKIIMLETVGNALIPIEPIPLNTVVKHPLFLKLDYVPIDSYPWDLDKQILIEEEGEEEDLDLEEEVRINPKDIYDESYEHFRLSLSKWLQRPGRGPSVLKQLEKLRKAAYRLPLFELRRRIYLLIIPVIIGWFTNEGDDVRPSILRKDCISLGEKDCTGMCVFANGKCKIHSIKNFFYNENTIRVYAYKIIDELLRYNKSALEILNDKVQILSLPEGIEKQKDSFIFKLDGRGDDDLFAHLGLSDRFTSEYSHGYVFPEEVSAIDLGIKSASESGLPAAWEMNGYDLYDSPDKIFYSPTIVKNNILISILNQLNMTYDQFLSKLHITFFDWSDKHLYEAAKLFNAQFIKTKKNPDTNLLEFDKLIGPSAEQFILTNELSIPFIYKTSPTDFVFFVTLDQLPSDITDHVKVRNSD
jgi:hypothetical protein